MAVCEDGDIVALDERVDAVGNIFEDALLLDILAKNAVEDEDFPAARCVYSQTGRGRDMAGGVAESLGNQFIAGLASLERRAHADSCTSEWLALQVRLLGRGGDFGAHIPTLTAVLESSSLALLPPPSLLLMLRRLELRLGLIMALMGRGTPFAGDVGGEAAIVRPRQRR